MPADQRRTARLAASVLAVAVLLVVWWWVGQGADGPVGAKAASTSSTSSTSSVSSRSSGSSRSPGAASAPTDRSGLPTVQAADLPTEARRTLSLIAAGGPYPYARDGVVFQNREHRLPREAAGYYHEYTVRTPGEGDRGPRRIITGRSGERYWTPDHYASFRVIVSSVAEGGGS